MLTQLISYVLVYVTLIGFDCSWILFGWGMPQWFLIYNETLFCCRLSGKTSSTISLDFYSSSSLFSLCPALRFQLWWSTSNSVGRFVQFSIQSEGDQQLHMIWRSFAKQPLKCTLGRGCNYRAVLIKLFVVYFVKSISSFDWIITVAFWFLGIFTFINSFLISGLPLVVAIIYCVGRISFLRFHLFYLLLCH